MIPFRSNEIGLYLNLPWGSVPWTKPHSTERIISLLDQWVEGTQKFGCEGYCTHREYKSKDYGYNSFHSTRLYIKNTAQHPKGSRAKLPLSLIFFIAIRGLCPRIALETLKNNYPLDRNQGDKRLIFLYFTYRNTYQGVLLRLFRVLLLFVFSPSNPQGQIYFSLWI